MRRPVAPVLCAAMLIASSLAVGCAEAPPPPPAAPPQAAPPAPPPPPAAPPPPKRTTKFEFVNGALKLPGPVVFQTGSDKLDPVSDAVLAVVEDYLNAKPDITLLRIEGHTDSDGRADANQTLSEKRAMSVARWLVGHGIACSRLIPVGFGQTKELVPNTTAENKSMNRRVAFVNAALKGKPIGGAPVDGGGRVAGDPCR